LSRAIARGDEAAFATFYAAWFPAAMVLARAASRRDEAFCLDVVQDVMFTVCRKLPALADARAVRAWMATAVWNATTDRVRAERRRRQREEVAAQGPDECGPEPLLALAAAERQQWLAARVQELPLLDQALLQARFAGASSVAAAGADFGLGEDAAHGRLRRVVLRLQRLAKEWWHGS
jgi:DNA-directed RNA polymerase specialized sigma24 family protein